MSKLWNSLHRIVWNFNILVQIVFQVWRRFKYLQEQNLKYINMIKNETIKFFETKKNNNLIQCKLTHLTIKKV